MNPRSKTRRCWFLCCCLIPLAILAQTAKPEQETIKQLIAAAEKGDADAQFELGLIYLVGQGVPQQYTEAVKWFQKAAANGHSGAQNNLGSMYASGKGVPKNETEALKWYFKAAEQGSARAQANLAAAYATGSGVRPNYPLAAQYARRGAAQGDLSAQKLLGTFYAGGKIVPRDPIEAFKWFNLAAAQGDEDAIQAREILGQNMTPQQVLEAQRRAAAFVPGFESAQANALSKTPKASGTGFLITTNGYLLTSFHLVDGVSRIVVKTKDKSWPAQLVRSDRINDLALLKMVGTFRPLPIAASQAAKLGDPVLTIGFPNPRFQGFEPKLTRGEISSLAGLKDDPRFFQISVPVQPGNSGGPLVDQSGNVIGMISLRLNELAVLTLTGTLPQNVNYAVKSAFALPFLHRMPQLAGHLKPPCASNRPSDDIIAEVQNATVLVQVF